RVIGRFLGYYDVVRVAFADPRRGYPDELSAFVHGVERFATAIPHGGPQASYHLIDHLAQRTAVRHSSFDALWNQLFDVIFDVLEIPVAAARLHGADRTHSPV